MSLALTCGAAALATVALWTTEDAPAELTWRGCGISKKAFMGACAEAFAERSGIEVVLSGGGATLGIEAAGTGGADLGGTCRACLPARGEDDLDVALTIVGWDALVVVVHPDNPLESISQDQLVGVLRQEVTRWNDVGGADAPIVVVARKGKESGVGHMVRRMVFGDPDADFGPTVVRLASSGPVEKLVERTPNALAVTGVSSARQRRLKILGIDGVEPTVDHVADGRYPYFRPLYLAHPREPGPRARRFLDWIVSAEGQRVIAEQETVDLERGLGLAESFRFFDASVPVTNLDHLRQWAADR